MKHLHLITGLLICSVMAGCGDYGDDGAVNSTGNDTTEADATEFTLAVAIPTFGPGGTGSKLRQHTERDAPVARAVTGSTAFTELLPANVRAFVVVPDNGNANGFREVSIDVVEFEHLGDGRYRIAIDGQAQVDGFFAIEINGVVFKVPLSRTGTTDAPIDVNALQSALADRLQALLVADEVCDTLVVDDLNAIFASGQTYMASLAVPDSINDLEALVSYYRVAATSFMQSAIAQACAPVLDEVAIDDVLGDYHALSTGVDAYTDVVATAISQSTSKRSISRQLEDANPGAVVQSATIERDNHYVVTHAADSGGTAGALSDLSVQIPQDGVERALATPIAFANDAGRALLQFDAAVNVEPNSDSRAGPLGITVQATPTWQLLPVAGSLFGASQTTTSYFDLGAASDACLTSLGLTSAQLDSETFPDAAATAIGLIGDQEFASRLQLNCDGPVAQNLDALLHVETRTIDPTTPLALDDLSGRYALVGLEWSQHVSATAATAGYGGSSFDRVFDIDAEGGMTQATNSRAKTFQPVAAALGGVDSSAIETGDFRLQLPLDQSQNLRTDGQVQLIASGQLGNEITYNGFVSASPHNLMALNLSALTDGGSVGAFGGYATLSTLPTAQGFRLAVAGELGVVWGNLGISAVDVGNPLQLQLHSTLTSITSVEAVAIDGAARYVFVAAGSQGLQVVDAGDPAAMTVVGSGIGSPDIAYASNVALVLNAQGGAVLALVGDGSRLHAIDVTDPAAPEALGVYDLGDESVFSLAVVGNTVLVGGYDFYVLDLAQFLDADPQSNSFTLIPDTLSIDYGVQDIAVVGTTAYLAADYDGLIVLDISDVADITEIGALQFSDYADSVSVTGNRAYVALSNEGYSGTGVVDLTDPANPQQIADMPADGDNAVVDGYLLVATNDGQIGLATVDITTPAPQLVGSIGQLSSNPVFASAGNVVYQLNAGQGFTAYDIADPANPVTLDVLDTTALGGTPRTFDVLGNYAYIVTSEQSLIVVDITSPANLAVVGTPSTLAAAPSTVEAFTQGTNRYLAVGTGTTVELINVTTAATPALAQSLPLNDEPYDFTFSSDGLTGYATGSGGIYVLALQSIGNATFDTFSTATDVRSIERDGIYLYAATGFDGLLVINADNQVLVGSYDSLQQLYSLQLVGTTAYVLGSHGIEAIDISDPAAMRATGFLSAPTFSQSFAVAGQAVVAANYDSNEQLPYVMEIYQVASVQRASTGIALGVRLSSTLTAAALVGQKFSLVGQQTAQLNSSETSRQAAFGALAGASLRFVSVGGAVYPVFDLPLSGMVVSDFSGVVPQLEIRFAQWQAGEVEVDGNGRWSFTLTSGDDSASFAGYVGGDGTLVGHGTLFDAAQPPVVDGSDTTYPGLNAASQLLVVGVPQTVAEVAQTPLP